MTHPDVPDAPFSRAFLIVFVLDENRYPWVGLQIGTHRLSWDPEEARAAAAWIEEGLDAVTKLGLRSLMLQLDDAVWQIPAGQGPEVIASLRRAALEVELVRSGVAEIDTANIVPADDPRVGSEIGSAIKRRTDA
jgi:hypothetical protein